MTLLKKIKDVENARRAGMIVATVLKEVSEKVIEGVKTSAFDKIAEDICRRLGGVPAFKGYHGYPASICVSIDDEVVHGIPSDDKTLKEGQIVSFDFGAVYRGYFADAALTVPVGQISEDAERLISVTERAFWEAFPFMKPGAHVGDISHAIQRYVESNGFSVIREFVGHSIGRALHEDPQIPNFGSPGKGPVLVSGMAIAVEPMVSQGDWKVSIDPDGWTARTADGSLSAHYEHTVLITDDGPVILTKLEN